MNDPVAAACAVIIEYRPHGPLDDPWGVYVPRCSCGWTGSGSAYRRDAAAESDQHQGIKGDYAGADY